MADHAQFMVDFNGDAQKAAEKIRELSEQISKLAAQSDRIPAPDFESRIRQLAKDRPAMTLSAAIESIDGGAHGVGATGATMRERAEWILSQSDIVDLLEDRKIQAIKEVRARTYVGLKEAKDAVEYAVDLKSQGWLSPAEREKLEEEAREAIASILASQDAERRGPDRPVARCGRCGHAPHARNACYNLASDNDCDCPGDAGV